MMTPLIDRAFAAVPPSEWAGEELNLWAALRPGVEALAHVADETPRGQRVYDEAGLLLAETATDAAVLLGCSRTALRAHAEPWRDGLRLRSRPLAGGRGGARVRTPEAIDKARETRRRNTLERVRRVLAAAD